MSNTIGKKDAVAEIEVTTGNRSVRGASLDKPAEYKKIKIRIIDITSE
jgi:hypothetical protein